MRTEFDEQLARLHGQLVRMGGLCEQAIAQAAAGLTGAPAHGQATAARLELEIDHLERDAEASCMRLLLLQQPVASDLRAVSAALRMIADLERIGDQASDIAEITQYTLRHPGKNKAHIRDMAVATIKMVTESVDSFVQKDLALARAVMAYDDVVDSLFCTVKSELIGLIAKGGDGEYCIDLLMIAKYLERIGDHATNIAEWVEFSLTGSHPKN